MAAKFDAFVIFAEMRTGSNYLEATLNDLPDLDCLGELYNPTFMGHHNIFEMHGQDMEARDANPLKLLDAVIDAAEGSIPGFRYFHDHDPRVLERILPDPRIAKVVLTRNPLESYVSRKIASETGQWRLTDVTKRRSAKVSFDLSEFETMLDDLQGFQVRLQRGLQETGQTAFYIRYEDINEVGVVNGLARYLGSEHELEETNSKLKKQNPSDLSEKVSNYSEMQQGLARLDRFDLTRTPNFEPKRHAGVPNFVALPAAGLLYVPIRGAADGAIVDWLADLAGNREALLRGMNQKELRGWMRRNPGFTCFTALRHPLERAYHVFNSCIFAAGRPAFSTPRRILRKRYKLPLPEKEVGPDYTLATHREAFLGFLRFLKANLAGQTQVKIEPLWASQTAILQGVADVTLPHRVFREEELIEALPQLAERYTDRELEFDMALPEAPFELGDLYDEEIEKAAFDAYRKDYLNFGFSPWQV